MAESNGQVVAGHDRPGQRPAIDWEAPAFLDPGALDSELRRVAGVCHTCRRCEDLCESFPRLFDLIDGRGGVGTLGSGEFESVGAACTLCDMCYPVCPYTPPHVHAVDFPALMIRQRAHALSGGKVGAMERALGATDRNGRLLGRLAPLANWAARRGNSLTRPLMEALAGIHRDAVLPRFHARTFSRQAAESPPPVVAGAPAAGRKAVLYSTCFVEYNNPGIGRAARAVLAKNGVETEVVYDECCGMPQLERGDIADVCRRARRVAASLGSWIERGYDVIAPIPSCALMLKTLWPLHLPEDEAVARLARHTKDVSEYVIDIARSEGLADGMTPLDGDVALHQACHARAQDIGAKAAVMLRMIPQCNVLMMQRCAGHGGTWGVMKRNFETGMKVGEPVIRQSAESGRAFIASECPLAGDHIVQGMERFGGDRNPPERAYHPIELMAMSYGINA
ncbi:MAG: heterodisulfide reductase-related iron-sulfur binding cluster [Rhodospirillales bacterium]|nr:heterodisulfide reductase-related iron-sulfur binding cluster [Rhodospirillales bacterium]MDE0378998.1 heterodisulfide reductase-related iron-sulfur binding cluster [Rhodospirillales bacterium]